MRPLNEVERDANGSGGIFKENAKYYYHSLNEYYLLPLTLLFLLLSLFNVGHEALSPALLTLGQFITLTRIGIITRAILDTYRGAMKL